MKNVLILTASTGGGHNQVAFSLQNELTQKGLQVITIEPLKERSKVLDSVISDGYNMVATRLPKMYGGIYKISNRERVNRPLSKFFIKALGKRILSSIEEFNPVVIISTHPIIVNVVAALKDKGLIQIPFISVVTDFDIHTSYVNQHVDAYIVGSEYTKNSLVRRGILPNKIYSYGIPIRREFHDRNKKNTHEFTILLMGGSMGVSYIKKALKALVNNDYRYRIIVVCGKNETLKNSLFEKYSSLKTNKKIQIYGFTKEIPQLMDQSDIVITKPGGLTTSEALAKRVPMIIPFYIPGQEEENVEFLLNEGAAFHAQSIKELQRIITSIMEELEILDKMKEHIERIARNQSLDGVVNLIEDTIDARNIEIAMQN